MRDVLSVLAAAAVALALVAGVVIGLRDRTVFVSPPEAVAEAFARSVATRRYDVAMKYVADGAGITPAAIRRQGDALRAEAGGVNQVDGESSGMSEDRASARAVLTTDRARVTYDFELVLRHYEWKIATWRRGN